MSTATGDKYKTHTAHKTKIIKVFIWFPIASSDTSGSTPSRSGRERLFFGQHHLFPCFHFLITSLCSTLEGLCFGNVPFVFGISVVDFSRVPISMECTCPDGRKKNLSNFVFKFLITNPWAHPSFRKLFVPREGGFSIFRPLYFRCLRTESVGGTLHNYFMDFSYFFW